MGIFYQRWLFIKIFTIDSQTFSRFNINVVLLYFRMRMMKESGSQKMTGQT